ncbi:Laccase [Lachnellula willkommii]|uniref:Laccase n=1 Tax=Lachnellula willkommii TaxID=215461 RepID=A0A559MD65_9HELO|nr:Laccase [Lachnellula willkommii]
MDSHQYEPAPRHSGDLNHLEMQERDDGFEEETQQRLLAGEDVEATDELDYKVEWHLRTIWAVLGSILAAGLVFIALVLFTKHFIVSDNPSDEDMEISGIGSFRRPASDYILDPAWDFDAERKVRAYKWTITDIVGNPDGVFRPMLTINGIFPGPMIECNEGDTIASDGLYGPLVVHGKDEKNLQKIPYETDRVIMLQDFYHDLSSGLLVSALEPGSEASPIPNGALINGLNQRDCSKLPHRMCDNSSCSRPFFGLTANASHRLRFINVGAFAWFQVSVDEHGFAVTEADGTDLIPAYETRLMISPAQRYSMILNTNLSSADSFWLRAKMVTHCWKNPDLPGPGADEVQAVIQYTKRGGRKIPKSLMPLPSSENWKQGMEVQCRDMNTTSYVPASVEPAPVAADFSYYLRSNLEIGAWRLERGFFNTSTLRPNLQQPTLHRSVEGLTSRNETFTASSSLNGVNSVAYDLKNDFVIQHTGIKTVDIIIQNFDEGNHPMHLHGHKFYVLGQGHGMFPGYEFLGLQPEGKGILDGHEGALDNLIRRDVATAEGFGWLALRFIADNPGVWAFHCHMAWHSEAGLAMQFLSRVDEVAQWEIPQANRELCTASVEELEKGAAPKDSIWYGFGIGG